MNNPKDIAEKMTSCLPDDVTSDDLQTLALAYLELENKHIAAIALINKNISTLRMWTNPNSYLGSELLDLSNVNSKFLADNFTFQNSYLDLKSEITKLKKENTKVKEENERLNSYVISGYEIMHKEMQEEITKLKEENEKLLMINTSLVEENDGLREALAQETFETEKLKAENLKLEEQVFKDTEYIGYIQDQLELSKSVLLQKTLEIDNLNASIKNLKECVDLLTPKIKAVYLNNLAAHIHKTNVEAGWWTDLATGEPLERNVGELLCLVHSEVSEALEAYRKSLMDDKLPHRTGFEVELADALIRIFDIAGKFMLDLDGALEEKMAYNANRADHKLENRQGKNGKKF